MTARRKDVCTRVISQQAHKNDFKSIQVNKMKNKRLKKKKTQIQTIADFFFEFNEYLFVIIYNYKVHVLVFSDAHRHTTHGRG